MSNNGAKHDASKLDWSALPLEVVEPLVKVFMEREYGFENGERRFFAAAGTLPPVSVTPLAIDTETGCYHEALAAWNHLMRLWHALRAPQTCLNCRYEPEWNAHGSGRCGYTTFCVGKDYRRNDCDTWRPK